MMGERIAALFGTGRFRTLLLEVFAIFLGISASFAVEEWRQRHQDIETFEHFLEAIYFDAARSQSVATRMVYQNNQVIGALDRLLKDSAAELPDQDLLELLFVVFQPWTQPHGDSNYQALLEADLTLPLDDTLQRLNDIYAVREMYFEIRERLVSDHSDAVAATIGGWGNLPDAPILWWDEAGGSMITDSRLNHPMYAGVKALLDPEGGLQHRMAERARGFLQNPDNRQILVREMHRVVESSDAAIAIMSADQNIKAVVRERLPGFTLPVRTLGLVGSATPGGWVLPRAEALRPEAAGSDWWGAKIELGEGSVKFVANQNYGTSWGVDYAWDRIDPLVHPTFFLGDPATVFPSGVGKLDGQNIPVRPGVYRVRFNIRSFEYRFDRDAVTP